ncbi:MAG TPA: DUF1778 domain-containing protein [Terriglobales bacterium]|jgi:uncharacterized protein (DUF1778 family)
MPTTGAKRAAARGEVINLRASRRQKLLISQAAEVSGRSRSDFMLEAACREAESVLLDRRFFVMPQEKFDKFVALLDRPPRSSSQLRRLLLGKPQWEA